MQTYGNLYRKRKLFVQVYSKACYTRQENLFTTFPYSFAIVKEKKVNVKEIQSFECALCRNFWQKENAKISLLKLSQSPKMRHLKRRHRRFSPDLTSRKWRKSVAGIGNGKCAANETSYSIQQFVVRFPADVSLRRGGHTQFIRKIRKPVYDGKSIKR